MKRLFPGELDPEVPTVAYCCKGVSATPGKASCSGLASGTVLKWVSHARRQVALVD